MRLAVFAAMMLLTACSDDDNTAEPLKLRRYEHDYSRGLDG